MKLLCSLECHFFLLMITTIGFFGQTTKSATVISPVNNTLAGPGETSSPVTTPGSVTSRNTTGVIATSTNLDTTPPNDPTQAVSTATVTNASTITVLSTNATAATTTATTPQTTSSTVTVPASSTTKTPTPTLTTTTQSTTTSSTTTATTSTTATTTGTSQTTASPVNANNILIGCLVFLAVAIIIFAVVLYYYCNNKNFPWCAKFRGGDGEDIPLDDSSNTRLTYRRSLYGKQKFLIGQMNISADDFESDYMKKSADDNRQFRMEFMSVDQGTSDKSAAYIPENKIKNRYENVLPYDVTRVKLSQREGEPNSDYINANFVSGYLCDKKWIACQGPKEETFVDFWKMMWEQNSSIIIMVTNLIEQNNKVKCHQYWPESVSTGQENNFGMETYGDFTVQTLDIKKRGFYVMRTFRLTYLQEVPRNVYHFHYVVWPDFGVPSNASHLLQFRRRIIAKTPSNSGPTVIHCSAGVGRTGTYILIDAAIEQLKTEGKVDLYSYLSHIRTQRMMLVQTDAQYSFAHRAVLEFIKYGNTEVPSSLFKKQVQDLRERIGNNEETELEAEFQKLLKMPLAKDHLKHGRKSLKKNRVLQIMPYDFNRVVLPRKPGNDRSDYINASYIDGFYGKKTFIATQGPLPETVHDFWTMVWQENVANIVMLTRLEEKGHSTCYCYWPSKETNFKTENFTVSLDSQDDDDIVDYVVREFILTNDYCSGEERKIRQFHYKGWPDVGSGTPKDAQGLVEIINRLQMKDSISEPILVHCSSGGGRTGVFCALANLISQAECEGLVDVFQTVRFLREQRPHMIQTLEQYYYCYMSLLQYLESNQDEDSDTLVSSLPPMTADQNKTTIVNSSQHLNPVNNGNIDNMGSMNNTLLVSSTSSSTPSENEIVENTNKNEKYDSDVPLVDAALIEDAMIQTMQNTVASSTSSSDFELVNESRSTSNT